MNLCICGSGYARGGEAGRGETSGALKGYHGRPSAARETRSISEDLDGVGGAGRLGVLDRLLASLSSDLVGGEAERNPTLSEREWVRPGGVCVGLLLLHGMDAFR